VHYGRVTTSQTEHAVCNCCSSTVVHHFARERVMRKEIEFKYIPTFEQVADVLTKALPDTKHTKCLKGMGMN